MNETKRMLALLGVIVVVVGLICVVAFWPEKDTTFTCKVKADKEYKKVAELQYENFDCLQKESDYLVAVTNKVTNDQKKALNETLKSNEHGVYLVSLEDYSKEDAASIKKALNYADNAFEKDVLLYVQKGKVKAYKEDILTSNQDIKEFLQENGLAKFMCNAVTDEENPNLGTIDYSGFECLFNQEEPYVLVVAQTTCSYCLQFKPVLNKFAEDNKVNAYVINVDQLSEEQLSGFTSSFEYFATNTNWGTPLSLAVKNKEVVGELSGFTEDTEAIKDLFTKAGILE